MIVTVYLPQFIRYGAEQMAVHIEKGYSRSSVASGHLLSNIYQFFESDGCKLWVKNQRDDLETRWVTNRVADRLLEAICLYLRQWKQGVDSHPNSGQERQVGLGMAASTWGLEILRSPLKLGEYCGITINDELNFRLYNSIIL